MNGVLTPQVLTSKPPQEEKRVTLASGAFSASLRVASLQKELYEALSAIEPTPR